MATDGRSARVYRGRRLLMTLPITTERLELRPYRPQDVAQIHGLLYGDPEVRRLTGGVSTLAETWETIERYIDMQRRAGYSYWPVVERATGDLVGEVGLKPLDDEGPEVELGFAFAAAYWGRGYATEAGRAVLDEAFGQLGLEQVFATAREENAASRHVLGKLGFTDANPRQPGGAELLYFVVRRSYS